MNVADMSLHEAADILGRLRSKIGESIFGQEDLITETLCCLLAGGHILLTGAPGLAKTTLVRVFSRQLQLQFGRVQFTPDLLPSDIIGADILNIDPASGHRNFEFAPGPVFTNLLLADEINRASPRTQSALLEAMQERSVTVGGQRHILPQPFLVFATQNPFESEGTFPLPEAQLDRFLLHTIVPYPDGSTERQLLKSHAQNHLAGEQFGVELEGLAFLDNKAVTNLIAKAKEIVVEDEMVAAISDLVRSSRPQDELCPEHLRGQILYGAGPRAGLSLISTSRALALMQNNDTVRWHHVRRLVRSVLRHRIKLSALALRHNATVETVIDELLQRVEAQYISIARGHG